VYREEPQLAQNQCLLNVDLARVAFGIVVFRRALCDFETCVGDDDVGGVGGAGPFLAVGAVAEGCYCWFALEE
jgi:hypothetical protein